MKPAKELRNKKEVSILLAQLHQEVAAFKKAKQENDERFQLELGESRQELKRYQDVLSETFEPELEHETKIELENLDLRRYPMSFDYEFKAIFERGFNAALTTIRQKIKEGNY